MKKLSQHASIALLTALSATLLACGPAAERAAERAEEALSGRDAPTEEPADILLHDDYAGYTEVDEDVDFGDVELASANDLSSDGEPVDDVITDEEAEAGLEEAEADGVRARRLFVTVLWGHLRPGPAAEVSDWTGSLTAENAALRVRRAIRFEADDQLNLPRENPQTISFESTIGPHVDGLLVEVILHPDLMTVEGALPSITLDTPMLSRTLPLGPFSRGSRVFPAGEDGYGVAFHIMRPPVNGCAEGLIAGRYFEGEPTEDGRPRGLFKGKWVRFDGEVTGKVIGRWGRRVNGTPVMFGKIINNEGAFQGLLAGRYGPGRFQGRILGEGHVVKGLFRGHHRAAPQPETLPADGVVTEEADAQLDPTAPVFEGGFFRGRWAVGCQVLDNEGAIDNHDEDNADVDGAVDLEDENLDQPQPM